MAAAIWGLDVLLEPWLTGYFVQRYLALAALVAVGCAIYGVACFLTRAFLVSDLKALIRRRSTS